MIESPYMKHRKYIRVERALLLFTGNICNILLRVLFCGTTSPACSICSSEEAFAIVAGPFMAWDEAEP
jgi:hypothetical protein